MVRQRSFIVGILCALLVGAPATAAFGQENDNSRAVRIIEEPGGLPSEPAAPRPTAQPIDLAAMQAKLKAQNPAELRIDLLPGPALTVGSKLSFRVGAKKAGYLLLIDVDPRGKLTQIYPNPMSLLHAAGDPQNANLIKPGTIIQVPVPGDQYAGFEFVAEPPLGIAMVIGLLSEHPVQMIDLPELPADLAATPDRLTFFANWAGNLRVPQRAGATLFEPKWSIDAKVYAIR